MTREPPLVIEDREELIFLLSEAAALGHMIMCQYLFAAFSLKRDVSEGVTAAQLAAIQRWGRVVSLVATQEMLHLALVCNLLTAIGHLYRGIEQGFRHLVAKYGEQRVFIGPPRAQVTQEYFGWPELIAVTDLASAVQAIETIIVEGEGARGDWREAHYGKFLQVMQAYRDVKRQDPGFEPARPVVAAYVRQPGDTSEVPLISDPETAGVSELFNASYEVLLQLLMRYFIHGKETEEELQTLCSTAVSAMFMVIKPLDHLLTTLPIGPDLPGKLAGPTFEMYRTGYILPHHDAAWIVLHERLLELAAYCGKLGGKPPALQAALQAIGANLRRLAAVLEPHVKTRQAGRP